MTDTKLQHLVMVKVGIVQVIRDVTGAAYSLNMKAYIVHAVDRSYDSAQDTARIE